MAESDTNRDELIDAVKALQWHFESLPDVYVSGNLLLYYVQGDPQQHLAPDVFVVRGIGKRKRDIYKVWEEGKAPDLVIEISSTSTWREDLGNKRAIYQRLGVQEYYLFDPRSQYLKPPLKGYRLRDGEYRPLKGPPFRSRVLGLLLEQHGERLRFREPASGALLSSPDEERSGRLQAEQAREQAEQAREQAEQARQQEREARLASEQRARELEQQLERLRRERD